MPVRLCRCVPSRSGGVRIGERSCRRGGKGRDAADVCDERLGVEWRALSGLVMAPERGSGREGREESSRGEGVALGGFVRSGVVFADDRLPV